jgi:hypothetical protein
MINERSKQYVLAARLHFSRQMAKGLAQETAERKVKVQSACALNTLYVFKTIHNVLTSFNLCDQNAVVSIAQFTESFQISIIIYILQVQSTKIVIRYRKNKVKSP